jgi:hypothetical protein
VIISLLTACKFPIITNKGELSILTAEQRTCDQSKTVISICEYQQRREKLMETSTEGIIIIAGANEPLCNKQFYQDIQRTS